jgi:pectate lyase
MVDNAKVTADNWNGGVQPKDGKEFIKVLKLDQPWPAMPIEQQTAQEAYVLVLENVGAILPKRDAVDTRIIDETVNGYATYEGTQYEISKAVPDSSKKCGIIESHLQVGGWPELKSETAPTDSDHDGMPDEWESKNKLNKENPDDRNIVDSDGYTMLEKYLNSIN